MQRTTFSIIRSCLSPLRPQRIHFRTPRLLFRYLNTSSPKIEEENWPWYSADTYYPVQIGQVFEDRYRVIGKLGYGAHSTTWLGRDLNTSKYIALKVCERDSYSAKREVAAYEHLNAMSTAHPGGLLVREVYDNFRLGGPTGGQHFCIVQEPLWISVDTLRSLMPGKRLSVDVLKAAVGQLLVTLDFLHTEAKMVHTDLQASNIHFRTDDSGVWETFEADEVKDPSTRKIDGERIVYESRGVPWTNRPGPPVLCDFGEARFGEEVYTDDIQPYIYRAPEVMLGMPWSYPVDIWNVGVMAWDLFEKTQIFRATGPKGEQSSIYNLTEMIAILGPPPLEFLRRCESSREYFEADGSLKDSSVKIPEMSMEALEAQLEDNELFLAFMRKMLCWDPEKRETAGKLLEDEWLMAD